MFDKNLNRARYNITMFKHRDDDLLLTYHFNIKFDYTNVSMNSRVRSTVVV